MNQKIKSYTLVVIQLVCISLIAFTGSIIPGNGFSRSLGIAGLLLGIWAIVTMRPGRFNITPDVSKNSNSRMVSWGPYKYIRHPMYASVLMITVAWVLDYFTTLRFVIWIVLLTDLIWKLRYEEKLLANRYVEYKRYQKRTKSLIPFVF
jgi:protein-S-isoprenylcysteine O-methyltransferase Ste14